MEWNRFLFISNILWMQWKMFVMENGRKYENAFKTGKCEFIFCVRALARIGFVVFRHILNILFDILIPSYKTWKLNTVDRYCKITVKEMVYIVLVSFRQSKIIWSTELLVIWKGRVGPYLERLGHSDPLFLLHFEKAFFQECFQ